MRTRQNNTFDHTPNEYHEPNRLEASLLVMTQSVSNASGNKLGHLPMFCKHTWLFYHLYILTVLKGVFCFPLKEIPVTVYNVGWIFTERQAYCHRLHVFDEETQDGPVMKKTDKFSRRPA
ncbi:hypothetical protein NW752_010218 [Fusarium irregulare]|uniref:Uncharacterized protein n=1 Tax=Fusarium irregulare TaxID=2494466 RepID=A0A9W8U5T1_9HYPO|nr:hypothetical protein NW752_010218 [Fusarium irregulare]KAJ4007858.1 hypothetical protein NW766_009667 [Fusarium irregulare]